MADSVKGSETTMTMSSVKVKVESREVEKRRSHKSALVFIEMEEDNEEKPLLLQEYFPH